MMGLRLCFAKWMRYMQCILDKEEGKGKMSEKGKCLLALTDFSKSGLLEDKEVFTAKIPSEYTVDEALREAGTKMRDRTYPAVLAMEYEKNSDGTQPHGHCLAIMPSGEYIDVKERRYWKLTPDSRVSEIHVVNVKESNIVEWQRNCGLHNCQNDCIVCTSL